MSQQDSCLQPEPGDHVLTLERTIAASPDKLYRAWTEPALLMRWFAPLPLPVIERWANLIYTMEQPFLWALAACRSGAHV